MQAIGNTGRFRLQIFRTWMAQIMSGVGKLGYGEFLASTDPSLTGSKPMNCKACTSESQRKFSSEINVHFPGIKNLDKPTVFVFPKILVCLDCGFTEFVIPETELLRLGKETPARGTTRSSALQESVDLSEFVAGLPFTGGEIETRECAADVALALKNGFYRQ